MKLFLSQKEERTLFHSEGLGLFFKYVMECIRQNAKYLKFENFSMSLKIQSEAGFVRFSDGR